MQFSIALIAFVATALAAPTPEIEYRQVPASAGFNPPPTGQSGAVTSNPNLVPQLGVSPNTSPDGTGNCKGSTAAPIPCFCPPTVEDFTNRMQQFVSAGSALGAPLSFPTDNSAASQIARLQAGIVTLQSMNGTTKGVGCPSGASTFTQQIAALSGQSGAAAGSG